SRSAYRTPFAANRKNPLAKRRPWHYLARKAAECAPRLPHQPEASVLKLRSGRWFGGIAEPSELPGGGRIGYRGVDDISAARSLQEFTDDSPPVPARAQGFLPPLAVVDLGAVAEPLDRRLPRAPRPHVGLARAGVGRAQAAAQGPLVAGSTASQGFRGLPAPAGPGRWAATPPFVPVPGGAQSEDAHVLRAWGTARRPFRRGGVVGVLDQGTPPGPSHGGRAEDPDEQRHGPDGSGASGAV